MTDRSRGCIALTFDDGPDPAGTPAVLDALRAAGVRATFFVIADRAQRHPQLARALADAGHEAGLHCYHHIDHRRVGATRFVEDLLAGLHVLRSLGFAVRRWRPPWGRAPAEAFTAARRHGLRPTGWSLDPQDWAGSSAGDMAGRIGGSLGAGDVVLLHDGVGPGARRDSAAETAALIPALATLAKARGWRLGPVSDRSEHAAMLRRRSEVTSPA